MTYLVGTDIGIMGTKSVLVDAEGAPLGDAILAGLGTGVITDHRVIEDWLGEKVKTEPNPMQSCLYDAYYDLDKSSLEANRKIFEKMGEI